MSTPRIHLDRGRALEDRAKRAEGIIKDAQAKLTESGVPEALDGYPLALVARIHRLVRERDELLGRLHAGAPCNCPWCQAERALERKREVALEPGGDSLGPDTNPDGEA